MSKGVDCLNDESEDVQKAYVLQCIQCPNRHHHGFPLIIQILSRSHCPITLVDFAIANGVTIGANCPGALLNVAFSNHKERIRRAIDLGFTLQPLDYQTTFDDYPKIQQNLYRAVQFRLNARKLAIITIGAHCCKSQINKPGFIDICKIIARLVWSARFAGSEWE